MLESNRFVLPMLGKARKAMREGGVSLFFDRAAVQLYRRVIRPLTPDVEQLRYNGVETALSRKLFDRIVPTRFLPHPIDHLDEYEGTLIAAVAEFVRPGNRVVIVGGGAGITVVHAARQVGPEGSVTCFEGARQCVRNIERALLLNGVSTPVDVRHAVVARPIFVYGKVPAGGVVSPQELPECDVLELDCEGAEVDILSNMTIRPRTILVETHGLYGAPTEATQMLLESLGYSVKNRGVAEPSQPDYCREHDVYVLVGTCGST